MLDMGQSIHSRLRDVDFPLVIETTDLDFISEFYEPMLSVSRQYKRGVGYFRSSWFQKNATGMKNLAENGGKAKWIISPHLTNIEWEVIKKGEQARRNPEVYSELDDLVEDIEQNLEDDTKSTIAWMVADGLLDLKIALPSGDLTGDFHDKWGVAKDHTGDRIAFHGSQNDSKQGLLNYESFSVFLDWKSERENTRVSAHESRFDAIWNNRKENVNTLSLPDSIAVDIANLTDQSRPYDKPSEKTRSRSSYRWRHQETAVKRFFQKGNGILDMATGTGKTRTSLKIFDRMLREGDVSNLVVATYGNDLLDQWNETLLNHFDEDMLIYHQYGGTSQMGSFLLRNRNHLQVLIISYDKLHKCIQQDSSGVLTDSLLVADEVHNMGSETRRERLEGKLKKFPYRLGLSATPLDSYNEERNEFLLNEVGPIVFEFSIEDAINRRILCEFEYQPLVYSLSEEDKEKQKDAFTKYKAMKESDPTIPRSRLYIMLSRVRKQSVQKLPVFREYITDNPEIFDRTIIFVETMEYGKKVQQLIHEFTKQYRTYYGVDDEKNLQDFSDGEVSTLITSRAISEGIDIKSVKNVIFFSSGRSRRTTIQRMGRALRTDPSDPKKVATVVDFVVDEDLDGESDNTERTPADKDRYEWLKELSSTSYTC